MKFVFYSLNKCLFRLRRYPCNKFWFMRIRITPNIISYIIAIIIAIVDFIILFRNKFSNYLLLMNAAFIIYLKFDILLFKFLEIKSRKKKFDNNKNICSNTSGKYKEYFSTIEFSEDKDGDIISLIEYCIQKYCKNKNIEDIDEIDGIRISVLYTIFNNITDPYKRDKIHIELKNVLSQYNFRSKKNSINKVLKSISNELNLNGKKWKNKTLNFIAELVPSIEIFRMQEKLNQVTRFKDFLKERFASRFTSLEIIDKIQKEGKENCYWIIAKNINPEIKEYLKRNPIFATIPGNNHNFPGLKSIRFSHYLVRIEDPNVKDSSSLKKKLESLSSISTNMLLFIFKIQTKSIKTITSKDKTFIGESNNLGIAGRIILYFTTGFLSYPEGISDPEEAVKSGIVNLEEIIEILPLSFLIKNRKDIKPTNFDKIGKFLKDKFNIKKITDWRNVDKNDFFEEIRNISISKEISEYIKNFSEDRLKNICFGIIDNANELNKQLGL